MSCVLSVAVVEGGSMCKSQQAVAGLMIDSRSNSQLFLLSQPSRTDAGLSALKIGNY